MARALTPPVYGLTLLQPWPYAITTLGKRVENRGWTPPSWLMGKWFGLHGSVYPNGRKLQEALGDHEVLCRRYGCTVPVEDFATIAIHGVFALARVDKVLTGKDAGLSKWFSGPYGWRICELIVLPDPVPCKGAQRLWEISDLVMGKIRRQLGTGQARRWAA
jgi:hypothetical protein